MKKFLLCILVAVFIMTITIPASAVHIRSAADKGISEIEIGGEMLTRGWLFDETYTNDRRDSKQDPNWNEGKSNLTHSYWQSNFVIETAYVASEDLKGVWVIEIEDILFGEEGSGGNLGTNAANVLTNQLFVEFKVPTLPVTATVGLQNFTLGHSVILDDAAGGVNLNVAVDPLDINLFTFKESEREFDQADDTDYYGATFNASIGDMGSVGIFGMWAHANGNTAASENFAASYDVNGISNQDSDPATNNNYFDRYDAWWYGLTADLAIDPIEIAFEADFYQARWNAETGNRDYHASGWFTWLDIGANIGDIGKAGIAGFAASGNPNDSYLNQNGSDTYVSNNFTQVASVDRTDGCLLDWDNLFVRDGVAHNNSAGGGDVVPASDNDSILRNITSAKVYASLSPVDWLTTGFNTNLYWKTNDFRGDEDGEGNFYGFELDLDVEIQIYDQLVWAIEGGYMFTYDDAFDPSPNDTDNATNKAVGTDGDQNDEFAVDDIWAVTSTLVYSF